jgi:hypothetical protein
MNPVSEITRLLDLMPASGRMWTKLVEQPNQPTVIAAKFPLPWTEVRPITINFDLWQKLPQPQRDLVLLHVVCWLIGIRWVRVGFYQGLAAVGLTGMGLEVLLGNPTGVVTAGGLTAIAISRIWRKNRSTQALQLADEAAIQVAQRRGYSEPEAARHLLEGMAAVAELEGRSLTVTELIRSQTLRPIAGLGTKQRPQPPASIPSIDNG